MTEYKSFYKRAGGNKGSRCRYPVRLDTYGCGCAHDCGYCYAKSHLDFRGLWHPGDPSVADGGKIRKKLDKVPAGTVLRLGGIIMVLHQDQIFALAIRCDQCCVIFIIAGFKPDSDFYNAIASAVRQIAIAGH